MNTDPTSYLVYVASLFQESSVSTSKDWASRPVTVPACYLCRSWEFESRSKAFSASTYPLSPIVDFLVLDCAVVEIARCQEQKLILNSTSV